MDVCERTNSVVFAGDIVSSDQVCLVCYTTRGSTKNKPMKSVVDSISELNTNSLTNCRPYWRHVSLTDCMPPLLEARLSHRLHAAPTGGTSLSQTACRFYWRHVSLTDCMPLLLEARLSHRLHAASTGGTSLSLTACRPYCSAYSASDTAW